MKHQLEYMLTRLRLFIGDSESEDLVEYNLLGMKLNESTNM